MLVDKEVIQVNASTDMFEYKVNEVVFIYYVYIYKKELVRIIRLLIWIHGTEPGI